MRKTKKIELTKDAKHWHRLWSVRLAALMGVITAIEYGAQIIAMIVPNFSGFLDEKEYGITMAVLLSIQQVAKFIKQPSLSEDVNNERESN